MTPGKSKQSQQARVVHVQLCLKKDCGLQSKLFPHVLVTPHLVDLRHGNAKAVSYTWGEFNRQKRCIGHYADGRPAMMELGDDWYPATFAMFLHNLGLPSSSAPYAPYLWLDQLCIRQDDPEDVRKTLASIPDIYKNFETVVLMPGGKCPCFDQRYQKVKALGDEEDATVAVPDLLVDACFNMISVYTYGTRVWTRQELLYASKVRVVWVSPRPLRKCPRQKRIDHSQEHPMETCNDPATLWLQRFLAEGRRSKHGSTAPRRVMAPIVNQKLEDHARQAWSSLLDTMREWWSSKAVSRKVHKNDPLLFATAFLAGVELQAPFRDEHGVHNGSFRQDPSQGSIDVEAFSPSEDVELRRFLNQLCKQGISHRAATHPRDYVVSVWVDCPRYQLPKEYKQMSLGELLQDAIIQLQDNFGVLLGSNAPLDVLYPQLNLSKTLYPHAWNPRLLIDSWPVRHLTDVYGTLASKSSTFFSDSVLAHEQRLESIPMNDKLYNSLNNLERDALGTLSFFERLLKTWTNDRLRRIRPACKAELGTGANFMEADENSPEEARNMMVGYLLGFMNRYARSQLNIEDQFAEAVSVQGTPLTYMPGVGNSVDIRLFRENLVQLLHLVDFDDVAFEITCAALGIQYNAAKSHNLRLLVRKEPPMLGLTMHNVSEGLEWNTILTQFRPSVRTHGIDPTIAYECHPPVEGLFGDSEPMSSHMDSCRRFLPLGVWVPLKLEDQPRSMRVYLKPPGDYGSEDDEYIQDNFQVLTSHPVGGSLLLPKQ